MFGGFIFTELLHSEKNFQILKKTLDKVYFLCYNIKAVFRNGPVVQLVRTLACHARGRRFEPDPGRHFADVAQVAERVLGKDEVTGSNPVISSISALISCQGAFVDRFHRKDLYI